MKTGFRDAEKWGAMCFAASPAPTSAKKQCRDYAPAMISCGQTVFHNPSRSLQLLRAGISRYRSTALPNVSRGVICAFNRQQLQPPTVVQTITGGCCSAALHAVIGRVSARDLQFSIMYDRQNSGFRSCIIDIRFSAHTSACSMRSAHFRGYASAIGETSANRPRQTWGRMVRPWLSTAIHCRAPRSLALAMR